MGVFSSDVSSHLVHPEVEAGHDGAAADNGGQGGSLAQDEVGQQHIEHRGQAPGHNRHMIQHSDWQVESNYAAIVCSQVRDFSSSFVDYQ